jgi:arabinofuranosyltransferase
MSMKLTSRQLEVLSCFVLAVLLSCLLKRGTLDDLYITFKYARNLADGHGFSVWNIGEAPIEGATSTVWMVFLGLGIWLGISPFWLSFTLGTLSFGALVALFRWASNLPAEVRQAAFPGAPEGMLRTASLLTLSYLPLAWYAATGMETTFFSLLLAALLLSPAWVKPAHRPVVQSGLVATLVLTRPEGLLLGPLLCAWFLWTSPPQARNKLPLTVALATAAGLTLFRVLYFGDIFPNTYYAKAAGDLPHHLYWGGRNLVRFLAYTSPAWLITAFGLFKAQRAGLMSRFEWFLTGLVLFYGAYMLKSGGDPESAFPLWRHFVHVAPVWLLLAACAIERLAADGIGRKWWLLGAFVALTQLTLTVKYVGSGLIGQPHYAQQDADAEFFAYVQSVTDDKTVAAAGYAGHWGWLFPGVFIDLWGLNDREIAHTGTYQRFGELDSRSNMAYVLGRAPDLINLDMNPDDILQGKCPASVVSGGRSKMLQETLANPQFKQNYLFLGNAPYGSYPRALFVHRKFAPTLTWRAPYPPELMAVQTTSLYSSCPAFPRP